MRSNEASDSWHRPVSWNSYNKALDPGYDLQNVTDLPKLHIKVNTTKMVLNNLDIGSEAATGV